MLGIENERTVHDLLMQRRRLVIVQHMQELSTDRIDIGIIRVDADTVVAVTVPVADNRGEDCEHAFDLVLLLVEIRFRFQIAQHRAAGAHDIHGMGAGGNALERVLHCRRQTT